MRRGVIYLVATPLGNLEDITLRALQTLREADLVACEDTRHTGRLLRHFEIEKPLLSYHEHNEARRADELVARALEGDSVAVVSDAGTPAISDPGYRVVRAAVDAGVRVVPIPGPSAAITALSASGLPTHDFLFKGFLPRRKTRRRVALRAMEAAVSTIVLYEAPHRILEALADLQDMLGDRNVVVARELTKIHEEFLRGTALSIRQELLRRPAVKGEFVVLVGPSEGVAPSPEVSLSTRVGQLETEGQKRMDAIKQAARERGITKRAAYAQLHGDANPDS
jgi:16S rRNA (cytidine1402-2'-O)-methyltransferase